MYEYLPLISCITAGAAWLKSLETTNIVQGGGGGGGGGGEGEEAGDVDLHCFRKLSRKSPPYIRPCISPVYKNFTTEVGFKPKVFSRP